MEANVSNNRETFCLLAVILAIAAAIVLAACLLGTPALGVGPGADEKGGFPPPAQLTAEEEADGVAPHPHEWNKTDIAVALISTAGLIVVGIVPAVLIWKSRHRDKGKKG